MSDPESDVNLELEAERHTHRKDNEYLVGEIDRLRTALHSIIRLDHHNHGPEGRATTLARNALNAPSLNERMTPRLSGYESDHTVCNDCPPFDYPSRVTRCDDCPRRQAKP